MTAPFNTQHAASALRHLAEESARRQQELREVPKNALRAESDEEKGSESPYLDAFIERGGSAAVLEMTNFSAAEFQTLWSSVSEHILTTYNVGRGRKSPIGGKDTLFMVLTVLKNGGHWDILAKLFHMKGPTFERHILNFINIIHDVLYSIYVEKLEEKWTMQNLRECSYRFENHPSARYATDVTFHHSNRPGGNLQEAKRYFSGKHHLYGKKVEMYVFPNGLPLGCTKHFPGATADIDIFMSNKEWHLQQLRKTRDERQDIDNDHLSSKYPRLWALLCDKGYQGLAEILRAIHPKKKPALGMLSIDDERFNRDVSADRILVENYFGRLCGLWNKVSSKWRWDDKQYDKIFMTCVALSNFHIGYQPLRQADLDLFDKFKNRHYEIGKESAQKRRREQASYRERRRRRLNMQFSTSYSASEDT